MPPFFFFKKGQSYMITQGGGERLEYEFFDCCVLVLSHACFIPSLQLWLLEFAWNLKRILVCFELSGGRCVMGLRMRKSQSYRKS